MIAGWSQRLCALAQDAKVFFVGDAIAPDQMLDLVGWAGQTDGLQTESLAYCLNSFVVS